MAWQFPARMRRFLPKPNVLVFRPSNGLLPATEYVGEANTPMGLRAKDPWFHDGHT